MANLITQWLNPNNFAVLRDKFNAVITVLSGGNTDEILTKSGTGSGEFIFRSIMDVMPIGQPWETFVTDLSLAPFNGKWIELDGKTISSTGGSGDYTSIEYKPLFVFLWDNFTNDVCAVSSGRGTSAEDDYDDDKFITLPDERGRFSVGYDSRIVDPSNNIWDADYSVMGKVGGEKDHLLTKEESGRPDTLLGISSFGIGSFSALRPVGDGADEVIIGQDAENAHNNTPAFMVRNKIIKAKN
jgi:hypothetical protein